ncbi:MAG TPA: N,N-dimethylformamidase beta subunit family domain-containing protein, partial [Candidatus Eisenbacteria bacterium]|nr:N,N-dimethylformamidase beta subunit family domain-containing protein [Candidatus Eisenbacteria bacterium]
MGMLVRGTMSVRTEFKRCSRISGVVSSGPGAERALQLTRTLRWNRLCCFMILILLTVLTPGCADWLPGAHPTPVENRREGSPDWPLTRPARAGEIEGYASAASARPGDRISLHVSTRSRRFDVRIYRLGWYDGAGARQIHEKRGIRGGLRPHLQPNPSDGLVACDWPASMTFRIGRRWTTGVYLARLTGADDSMQAFVPFVVREGRGRRRAPFALAIAVATWQAYNNWGGKSLYDFNSVGGERALRVSFDRPYAAGEGAWAGLGAGELLTVAHAPRKAGWEYPMIRWLEREGYDVAYATTIDLDADSTTIDGRRAILVAGHDEYWTRGVRDRFEAARNRAVNLAFFGANLGYW